MATDVLTASSYDLAGAPHTSSSGKAESHVPE